MVLLPQDAPVLVLIGPSGTGKSTIVKQLIDDQLLELTPTWTDRPTRPDEIELEHRFVTAEAFDELLAAGFFAHQPMTFFDLPYRYATPKLVQPAIGRVPVVMARITALPLVDKLYPNRIVYQIESPLSVAQERIQKRESTDAELGTRLEKYEQELQAGREPARRVFLNDDDLSTVTQAISAAIRLDFGL